jgi:hypothetical protein
MARYRLLRGSHIEAHFRLSNPKDPASAVIDESKVYQRGDIIETEDDLLKYNGGPMDPKKFELVLDELTDLKSMLSAREKLEQRIKVAQAAEEGFRTSQTDAAKYPANDTLESMSVAELRKYAEEEEIDLGAATKKDQILNIIRGQPVKA